MTDDLWAPTPKCPVCGANTVQAFLTTTNYRTCIRNGHVTPTPEVAE